MNSPHPFPQLTSSELLAALSGLGFRTVHAKGSHFFLEHADRRHTVVSVSRGETIGPGLIGKVLWDCAKPSESGGVRCRKRNSVRATRLNLERRYARAC